MLTQDKFSSIFQETYLHASFKAHVFGSLIADTYPLVSIPINAVLGSGFNIRVVYGTVPPLPSYIVSQTRNKSKIFRATTPLPNVNH